MSGVCGIWAREPDRIGLSRRVQAGLDAMAHRGRDGMSIYPSGPAALGHCLFDTGCNGMLVDEDGYAIAFDGRIDNREELTSLIAPECVEAGAGKLNDTALLLQAYRRFGTSLPEQLRGDFAIAILDPGRSALYLCRDHMGIKPLFYRADGDTFHFASEIKGLRAMARDCPFTVRNAALKGYIDGQLAIGQPERTYYEEVRRLLPGHWALVTDDGLEIATYWTLDPDLPAARRDGPEQLRALFTQAVNRRLRSTQQVGALLSGGIDSSSIASLIGAGETRRRPESVKVCSLIFAAEDGRDESLYIDAVVNAHGLDSVKVDGSHFTAFQGIDEIVAEQDHPVPAPNIPSFRQFLRRLPQESGTRIFLDGHGGDEAISHGDGLFQELAESGRWLRLWQAMGEIDYLASKRGREFVGLVRRKGLNGWRRKIGRLVKWRRSGQRDFRRHTPDGKVRPFEQALHLHKLSTPLFVTALEGLDHNAAAAGVEIRMPFLDVDLLEFCVTVPAAEKWCGGLSRAIIRRALHDVLPPEIATRPDKFDFTDRVRRSLWIDHAALVEHALRDSSDRLAEFADVEDLRGKWQTLRESGELDGAGFQQIWRAVTLSRWLAAQETGPAPQLSEPLMHTG